MNDEENTQYIPVFDKEGWHEYLGGFVFNSETYSYIAVRRRQEGDTFVNDKHIFDDSASIDNVLHWIRGEDE